MADASQTLNYLDPLALARLKNLELAARLVVDGLYTGHHRSPRLGLSVEFAEHRQYTPGVDPRHLDWKVLAKRDKLYIKQYQEQTNLRAYLLVDHSASMGYRQAGPITKLQYACFCAASLAYLLYTQHDALGLISTGQAIDRFLPPRQGRGHMRSVLDALEQLEPVGTTDLAGAVHQVAQRLQRRTLVIILSDLFTGSGDAADLISAVGHLRHRKHEVIVLQIVDSAELEFPFDDAGQIQDLETGRLIEADAQAVRRHYLQRIQQYLDDLRQGFTSRDVGYALANTSQSFVDFLTIFLSHRRHAAAARTSTR